MSGFAARRETSTGVHDPITARALAVDDICIVAVDVVGIDGATTARIQAESPFEDNKIVVTATHTHGGPAVMNGRLGTVDPAATKLVVDAAVRAASRAKACQQPASLEYADAGPLPIATDRRRGGHPVGARLQALRWVAPTGETIAMIVSYPCHPVVLGADNRHLTADYPAALRARLGVPSLFLTGCAGDINTGHPATASYSADSSTTRTFAEASRIGNTLADAIDTADWRPIPFGTGTRLAYDRISLDQKPIDDHTPAELAADWESEIAHADPGAASVLRTWIDWAQHPGAGLPSSWTGRVTAVGWGELSLVFLPGEPFLATGLTIARTSTAAGCVVVGYSDDCPGYLPTTDAYDGGGYEVCAAHRYYGMPAPFARGSAEHLTELAIHLLKEIESV
jgi:hypothetical protein